MRRRQGITLVEVLIAIFVMGIGLLALFTLFPVGAYNCAKAIKDDRTARIAGNANAIALTFNIRQDSAVIGKFGPLTGTGPTFPVYVDPCYFNLGSTSLAGIPRVATNSPSLDPNQWFTYLDDIEFQTNGLAVSSLLGNPVGSGTVNNAGSYTWSFLIQRLVANDPSTAQLTVVVYKGRTTQLAAGETQYPVLRGGTYGSTSLAISNSPSPAIRVGSWILDSTIDPNTGIPHAYFYRVVNITVDAQTNQAVLELQSPLKADCSTSSNGVIVNMENVAEVFNKGQSN
jgi:Prokaryotic N-terminal methylation motif